MRKGKVLLTHISSSNPEEDLKIIEAELRKLDSAKTINFDKCKIIHEKKIINYLD
jgi:hypothetical protein